MMRAFAKSTYKLAHVGRVRRHPAEVGHAGGVYENHGKLSHLLERRAAVLAHIQR